MNILVLQLKRIGDAILTAPALAALRDEHPDARITLVLAGAAGGLGDGFVTVDEVAVYENGKPNLSVWKRVALGAFDACYDLTGTDRSALMAFLSRAKDRVGYARFAKTAMRRRAYTRLCHAPVRELHTIDFHLALVGADGGEDGFAVGEELPIELPERYAVIHPGTARAEKYWEAERWAEVIAYLQDEHGLACVLTGSDDADELAHIAAIGSDAESLVGKLSLLELAAVIEQSSLAVGVDSAAMHLAATFRRPQVVLFGPTNPFHWRPRHENSQVCLAGENPANAGIFRPKHESAAMSDLSTEQVFHAIGHLLG